MTIKKTFSNILLTVTIFCGILCWTGCVSGGVRQDFYDETEDPTPCADNDALELPAHSTGDAVIVHYAYSLCYDEDHEQPSWVAYMLTRQRANGRLQRSDDFRPDPAIATESAQLSDYRGSGYTRGHLVPAGDMKWDSRAMSESFLLSNMSPQLHDFNNGIWNNLENRIRSWARQYDTIYVVTGPVLHTGLPTIGNGVSIPEYFYKVILDPERMVGIGFIVPHDDIDISLKKLAVSIDSVEQVTGIDFFHILPDDVEADIESQCDTRQWSWR